MAPNKGVYDLVGTAEIAGLAGVTPAAVTNWAARYRDFPRPKVVLAAGRFYRRRDIEDWLDENKR